MQKMSLRDAQLTVATGADDDLEERAALAFVDHILR
jgi:hypothetical protein